MWKILGQCHKGIMPVHGMNEMTYSNQDIVQSRIDKRQACDNMIFYVSIVDYVTSRAICWFNYRRCDILFQKFLADKNWFSCVFWTGNAVGVTPNRSLNLKPINQNQSTERKEWERTDLFLPPDSSHIPTPSLKKSFCPHNPFLSIQFQFITNFFLLSSILEIRVDDEGMYKRPLRTPQLQLSSQTTFPNSPLPSWVRYTEWSHGSQPNQDAI